MRRRSKVSRGDALPAGYSEFLAEVKARIAAAQTRAVVAVSSELIRLYWEIGRGILAREDRQGWGAKVVDRLAADLRRELPNMTGFSPRNLRYMREFARAWGPSQALEEMLQQPVATLPWGHNITLLTKLQDRDTRLWYANQAVENGWSRSVLERQPGDEPTIGLILCPTRGKTITEWALRGIDTPLAVARYVTGDVTLTQTPPPEMQLALPDLPALANELTSVVEAADAGT